MLNENRQIKIEVIGYTNYPNMELSLQKVQAVVKYLIDKGIFKDRLTIKGMRNKEPKAPNNSEKNKQKNRRVEFKFY